MDRNANIMNLYENELTYWMMYVHTLKLYDKKLSLK